MAKIKLSRHEAEEGDLPLVCVVCGAPATEWKAKRFSWCPPWVTLLYFFSPASGITVANNLTKQMRVRLPFCENHKKHWNRRADITWLSFFGLVILGIGAMVLVAFLQNPGSNDLFGYSCMYTFGAMVVWLFIVGGFYLTSIRPTKITDKSITLIKVARSFVDAVGDLDEGEEMDRPRTRRRAKSSQQFHDPNTSRSHPGDEDQPSEEKG